MLFLPWAALPWPIAWFLWRWVGVVLFVITGGWAYRRRPLGTAVLIAILGPAIAANFDTGNINIYIVIAVFAAEFAAARVAGIVWAIGTAMKWLPGVLLLVLSPAGRRYGVLVLAVFVVLSVATWPSTLKQVDIALYYPRPIRLDYMLLMWAAVPWLWKQPWPPWWLQSREIARHWRERPALPTAFRRFFGLGPAARE